MAVSIPEKNIEALRIIVNKLKGEYINWAIGGSMGLAIHEVSVEIHDIDIFTNTEGADKIFMLLREYNIELMQHKEDAQFKAYYGLFEINGIKVEVIADLEIMEESKWVKLENLRIKEIKRYKDMTVPILDIRHEHDANKRIGRIDKANTIAEFLRKEEEYNRRTRAS
jgi:hypothetical protein